MISAVTLAIPVVFPHVSICMGHDATKHVFGVSDQLKPKPAC